MAELYEGNPNPLEHTLKSLETFPIGHPLYKCGTCGEDNRMHPPSNHQPTNYLDTNNLQPKIEDLQFFRQLQGKDPKTLGELKQYGEGVPLSQDEMKGIVNRSGAKAKQQRIKNKYFGPKGNGPKPKSE